MQLQTASFNDHDRVMQISLDKEANLNARSEGYDYTLWTASAKGHDKEMQMLLAAGAIG